MRPKLLNNRGAALVEFAIVSVLLITLMLGIIEFGLLMKDYLTLSQSAREGSRSASLGSPTSVVQARVLNSAPTLTVASIVISAQKRPVGGSWSALGNSADGLSNDALAGDQVQVSLTYPHVLITGSFFSWLAGGGNSISIHTQMIMRRE
jgi:Flp pilus assembly protein TadG